MDKPILDQIEEARLIAQNAYDMCINFMKQANETDRKAESLEEKTSCITITTTQSDKLGYDWRITKVGDIEASKEYIPQADAKGTSADNPIIWEDGITPINNAFYEKDGEIVVYMDGQWIEWEI